MTAAFACGKGCRNFFYFPKYILLIIEAVVAANQSFPPIFRPLVKLLKKGWGVQGGGEKTFPEKFFPRPPAIIINNILPDHSVLKIQHLSAGMSTAIRAVSQGAFMQHSGPLSAGRTIRFLPRKISLRPAVTE